MGSLEESAPRNGLADPEVEGRGTEEENSEKDSALEAEQLLGAMGLLRRSVRRHGGRPDELSSLTGAQLELLRLVRRRPGLSVAEAAGELYLAANTVSTLVGQLTRAGLLVRTADIADRRVVRLDLVADTRRRVEEWRDRRIGLVAEAVERLPASERRLVARCSEVLGKLAELLEVEETEALGEAGR